MPGLPQGTLDLMVLRALARAPRHGYAIARWIEETSDDALAVEEGALYPALHRLQRHGWITARWARSELNKDIKQYELTADGRAELRRRTADWTTIATAMQKLLKAR